MQKQRAHQKHEMSQMQHSQLTCMKSFRVFFPLHVKFDLVRLIGSWTRSRAVTAVTDRALIWELDHRPDRANDRGADREADRGADRRADQEADRAFIRKLGHRPGRADDRKADRGTDALKTRLVAVLMIWTVAAHLMIRLRETRLIADRVKFDFDRMQPEFFNVQFDVHMQPHRWFKMISLISQRAQQAQQGRQKQQAFWLTVQQGNFAAREQREQQKQQMQQTVSFNHRILRAVFFNLWKSNCIQTVSFNHRILRAVFFNLWESNCIQTVFFNDWAARSVNISAQKQRKHLMIFRHSHNHHSHMIAWRAIL